MSTIRIRSRKKRGRTHLQVRTLTRLLGPLTFPFTTQNAYSGPWEKGWKRVRFACAGLLARDAAGTVERLEMAAEKPGDFPGSARATPRTLERGTERRPAFRRQARPRRHPALFQPDR